MPPGHAGYEGMNVACAPKGLLPPLPVTADLLRRPLRDLRLSVIEACNFRCPYCMPEEAVGEGHRFEERLSFAQLTALVEAFASLGVTKLRLTGGEPLLRKGLPAWIASVVRDVPSLTDIALTTNGSLLAKQAQALRESGLHRLTVSLDTLDEAQFREMSGGRGELQDVLDGLAAARAVGFRNTKLNCVLQRGVNESQILPLAKFARENGCTLRFIEFMDVGNCNSWSPERVVPSREVLDALQSAWPLSVRDGNDRGEVARRYAYGDGAGEIGLISSITEPFCGDCTRARISADGQMWKCLFGSEGTSLMDVLDGPAALRERIASVWEGRADRYSELRAQRDRRKVEMFLIGG